MEQDSMKKNKSQMSGFKDLELKLSKTSFKNLSEFL